MVLQGEGVGHLSGGVGLHAGDEDVAAAPLPHGGGDADDLLRRLAGAVEDLSRPLADVAVEVHLGIPQVLKGGLLEFQQGLLRGGVPGGYRAQEL